MQRGIDPISFVERAKCVCYAHENKTECTSFANAWPISSTISTYGVYKYKAKCKHRSFELTKDDFESITQQPCFYCLHNGSRMRGIDRMDSSKGYILDNVVAACSTCNMAKHTMSKSDFLNHCFRLHLFSFSMFLDRFHHFDRLHVIRANKLTFLWWYL